MFMECNQEGLRSLAEGHWGKDRVRGSGDLMIGTSLGAQNVWEDGKNVP